MNVSVFFIVAQILGIMVFLISTLSTLSTTRKGIIFYNTLGNFTAMLEYLCLGPAAFTGAICCGLAGVRNLVFGRYEKVPKWIVAAFITLLVIANIPFVDSFLSVVPLINVGLTAYALGQDNVATIKFIGLYTGVSTLSYDIINMAFTSVLTDTIGVVTTIGVIFELYRNHKKEKTLSNAKMATT